MCWKAAFSVSSWWGWRREVALISSAEPFETSVAMAFL
jgi:hypothetical protein